jgi:LPXTG-site transpeptidase (sortase) family protein
MTNPWRVIAVALGLSVVAAVVMNAQSLWLNLRYSVAPSSFSVPPIEVQAQVTDVVAAPAVLSPTLATPKPVGITNGNLARIPVGDGSVSYMVAANRKGIDLAFARAQRGKLFVAVEARGELWYVSPTDGRRYRVPSLQGAAEFIQNLVNPTLPASLASATSTPNTLTIPSLGLHVPVVYVSQNNEKAYQDGLKYGVVHYPGTAEPGTLGNDYIFGHSSDYWWSDGKFQTVFAVLPRIKQGADIYLTNARGESFTYRVYAAKVVLATDISYLGQYGYKRKLLTLQTSWPIGTALKRFVVLAELVQ